MERYDKAFPASVPIMEKPGSWFLPGVEDTCGRVTFYVKMQVIDADAAWFLFPIYLLFKAKHKLKLLLYTAQYLIIITILLLYCDIQWLFRTLWNIKDGVFCENN